MRRRDSSPTSHPSTLDSDANSERRHRLPCAHLNPGCSHLYTSRHSRNQYIPMSTKIRTRVQTHTC
jgi:hypothetical protein